MSYKIKLTSIIRDGGQALRAGGLIGQDGAPLPQLTEARYRWFSRHSFIGAGIQMRFLDWLEAKKLGAYGLTELGRMGHITADREDWPYLIAIEKFDEARHLAALEGRTIWAKQCEKALRALTTFDAETFVRLQSELDARTDAGTVNAQPSVLLSDA